MNQLRQCPIYQGHVKSRDTLCPFCRSVMPGARAPALAAMVAVGVSLLACGGSTEAGSGRGGTSTGGATSTTTTITTTTEPVSFCESNEDCAPNDYCHNNDFGISECRPRPTDCPALDEPVCGLDGQVYGNECQANAAGVSIAMYHSCPPPAPELFPCGAWFCKRGVEVCVEVFESSLSCQPLPQACSAEPSCEACYSTLPDHCIECYDDGPGAVSLSCLF